MRRQGKINEREYDWTKYKVAERKTKYDTGAAGTENVHEEADSFQL